MSNLPKYLPTSADKISVEWPKRGCFKIYHIKRTVNSHKIVLGVVVCDEDGIGVNANKRDNIDIITEFEADDLCVSSAHNHHDFSINSTISSNDPQTISYNELNQSMYNIMKLMELDTFNLFVVKYRLLQLKIRTKMFLTLQVIQLTLMTLIF